MNFSAEATAADKIAALVLVLSVAFLAAVGAVYVTLSLAERFMPRKCLPVVAPLAESAVLR